MKRSSDLAALSRDHHQAHHAFEDALVWARGLEDRGRVWAIEDCRHVSGALERFLLARGERVVRCRRS